MAHDKKQSWSLDQLAKSEFFHQKLHEWALLEVANAIESIQGEELDWNSTLLHISVPAWNRVIHRGIKPITVFAHPSVLLSVARSTGYYRMLAMVSQKSMNQVGLPSVIFEDGRTPTTEMALRLSQQLNKIISRLIEADARIDPREFDLWRGMAAGAQAQGSWQNAKGRGIELVITGAIKRQLKEKNLIHDEVDFTGSQFLLQDGRTIVFADEPDIAIYKNEQVVSAVEIKGGIDTAGVLERVGAAIKSLSRAVAANPNATTILLVQGVSVTQQAEVDLLNARSSIHYWFTIEEMLESEETQDKFFALLGV